MNTALSPQSLEKLHTLALVFQQMMVLQLLMMVIHLLMMMVLQLSMMVIQLLMMMVLQL